MEKQFREKYAYPTLKVQQAIIKCVFVYVGERF